MRAHPLLSALVAILLTSASRASAAEPQLVLDLWSGPAPGEPVGGFEKAEEWVAPKPDDKSGTTRLTNVSKPTISLFRPAKEIDTGTAVLVAPGGGYNILAWAHEGVEVAEWLNGIGITAAVLKYRVPRRSDTPQGQPPVQPLMDAQRALSLVRSKAAEWGIDAGRIGMLGFSAGGHLTAAASTSFEKRAYDAADAVDQASCRPDFAVIVYPGGMLNAEKNALRPELRVTSQTPPTFISQSTDDPVNPDNAVEYWRALRTVKVPVELHLYQRGGHGYGMRPAAGVHATWNRRCEEWMAANGWLRK